jgi:hypothetical protein
VGRYVIVSVDGADRVIHGGPLEWDGVTPYAPPAGTTLVTEADAQAGGYTLPPRRPVDVVAATLTARAGQALAVNGAYLALASPTAAQVAAQVGVLTRECSGLVRLLLRRLDTDEGT